MVPPTSDQQQHEHEHVFIEIGELKPTLLRAARLFLETVLVPTALLYLFLHLFGLVAGLSAVLAWCALSVGFRWVVGQHMPGTLLLCVGMLCGRATLALVLSSALVYLLQPVVGSAFMGLLFLGSALVGRPVTMRLARDFVAIPAHLFQRRPIRRLFTEVALIFGVSRLLDVGMSLGLLRVGLDAGLLGRGLCSGSLTVLTIAVCTAWGWRSIRRIPGVTLCMRAPRLAA
jgi:hypothetical protein